MYGWSGFHLDAHIYQRQSFPRVIFSHVLLQSSSDGILRKRLRMLIVFLKEQYNNFWKKKHIFEDRFFPCGTRAYSSFSKFPRVFVRFVFGVLYIYVYLAVSNFYIFITKITIFLPHSLFPFFLSSFLCSRSFFSTHFEFFWQTRLLLPT